MIWRNNLNITYCLNAVASYYTTIFKKYLKFNNLLQKCKMNITIYCDHRHGKKYNPTKSVRTKNYLSRGAAITLF